MTTLCRALVFLLFALWLSTSSDASCSGTLFYKLATAGTNLQAVSVSSFGASYATKATELNGTYGASAGVGANEDYLCYLVISTTDYINCMYPSRPAIIFGGSVPSGFITTSQIQVAYANGHVALTRTSTSSAGRNVLHSVQDFHNGSWIPSVIDYEKPGYPETPALALVPFATNSLLYHYKTGYLSMETWGANTSLALPGANTLNQTESNIITSMGFAGNSLYARNSTSLLSLVMQEAKIGSWTPLSPHPYLTTAGPNIIASTSSTCNSIIVSVNVSSTSSEVYFYDPVAQVLESIVNVTTDTIAHLTWSSYVMDPTPPPTPVGECPQPSPEPATAFVCDQQTLLWTSHSSVNASSVTVSNAVFISGDLNVTTSITFNGLTANINVSGCINIQGGGLQLQLTPQELTELQQSKAKTQLLLTAGCPLSNALQVQVAAAGKKKCQKLTSTTTTGTSAQSQQLSTLSVILKLDGSSCKTWWIILASVLSALVVIALIAFILLATFNKKVKATFRPFWARKASERGV